jgi:MFS family permease
MGRLKNFISGARLDSTSPPPYLLHIRSSKLFILTTICVAVFTDIFLYGIIVPVIPFALSSRAGVAQSSVQSWVAILLAVYGAALLVYSPIAGWYADRSSSRRLPLLFGLVTLGGATVMLCLARTVALLVLGRILQGFSAAIVWTVGQALLVDTVGEKDIGQTLGYVSISMSMGILVAPLLGGVVYNKAGYYSVFYMAFGLVILDITLRLILIEKKIARQWGVDEAADSEVISAAEEPHDAENAAEEKGHGKPPGNLGQIMNARQGSDDPEKGHQDRDQEFPEDVHTPEPLHDAVPHHTSSKWPPIFTLMKSRRLLTALWAIIVQGSQMTAFDSVLPLFTQQTFHWNSIGAGLIFLTLMVPSFAAPLVGWASDKYGPRWLAVAGFIFAIPFWILLRLVTHDSIGQKVLLCALLTLIGISLALVMPPLMAEVTYVVEAKEKERPGRFGTTGAYAQAYGLFIAAFAAGTLIGPIWSGYVKEAAGWGTMSWSLGLFSLAAAVPCFFWTGGFITHVNAKSGEERAIGVKKKRGPSTPAAGGNDGDV